MLRPDGSAVVIFFSEAAPPGNVLAILEHAQKMEYSSKLWEERQQSGHVKGPAHDGWEPEDIFGKFANWHKKQYMQEKNTRN